jgi:valyl-tRNA synthetase
MEQKYDHISSEKEMQGLWQQADSYAADARKQKVFSIDTPPPTVSGSLHIGHIFSYTHTDIIARYKRMSSNRVVYPLGFDDNGLATERYVEKKRNITPHGMSRSDFIGICLEESALTEQQFEHLWKRMGLSVDWKLCYSTIDERSRYISQASFLDLYAKGYVYRKYEPSLYCTACRTAVAQAELDDADKESQFIDIAFTQDSGQELIISTTRPELLFSCVALFYHPADSRYSHLAGKQATVPYFGFTVPILPEETVEITKGTGLVMCCTFGDKNDIAWFKKHNLPYKQSIGSDGRWLDQTGVLAGLKAQPAREKIVEVLTQQGFVRGVKKITHAVTVHERCKKEIEYLALSQWFLNVLDHKQRFLDAADKIAWYPAFMKSRYRNWVENISWDWCLSRQRFYGIPFPVWHCTDCDAIIMAEVAQLPIDPQEVAYSKPCLDCGSSNSIPDTDVMDTWNTSSLTPYICASFEQPRETLFNGTVPFVPLAMRPQAHDIIRTWAFYTIVKTVLHHNTVPWTAIVISGHVLSAQKEKISKSQGNSPLEPENLLKNYPADVVRYWTASGSLGQDVAFSENQLKIGLKLSVKLWNAFKFISMHPCPANTFQPVAVGAINEWLLDKLSQTVKSYTHYLDLYEFGLALDAVEKFFWTVFCDNYIELIKDQLMRPELYSPEQVSATLATVHEVGFALLQLYAPYMPHVTEKIYQELYREKKGEASLHTTQFSPQLSQHSFAESVTTLEACLQVINTIRRLKTEKQLSLKTELATLTLCADKATLVLLEKEQQLIAGIAKAHKIIYTQDALVAGIEVAGDQVSVIVNCRGDLV